MKVITGQRSSRPSPKACSSPISNPTTTAPKRTRSNKIDSVGLVGFAPAHSDTREDLTAALDRGILLGESQNFARALINEPSNKLTPTVLADRALAMAREAGLAVEILDEKKIATSKWAHCSASLRAGSSRPASSCITYTPATLRGAPVLGLVGKAITFDTGGISIKPAEDMEKMKFDMAGGAAMIGVMRALAKLKPARSK